MFKLHYKTFLFRSVVLLQVSMLLVACAPAVNPAIVTAAPVEPVTIKLVLLPILDTLPMYVAQKEGLFAAKGVKVEFIPVGSAAERDQVIAAGQADGMINEVVSTILYNKEKIQVQIVRFARVSTNDVPMYRIIAAKDSGISDPAGLKGLEIGISQGTVIEYMTDRLLESEGLLPDEIKTIAVPKIPDRMALLSTGELKAAMLPDPFSFLAVQQGGTILLEDSKFPQYGYSTIAFRKETIEAQPAAIKAFLSAIEDATARINSNPEQYESLLSEQKLVPASLQGAYKIGPYPTASVPNEEQWNDVLAWAKKKGLVSVDVTYADSVNMSLLP